MTHQLIITDGSAAKSINPWNLDERPEAWTWLSNAPQHELDAMFYKVAASFRAVNKRAIAAANVPFQILRGEEVVDDSTAWKNKLKFLPKPKDLIKRISLSLTFTNKAYLLQGKDVLHQVKGLHFLVPNTVIEYTDPVTGGVKYFERRVNATVEKYLPDDPRLVKIWLLDHTTELLPSKNTAAQAIFNATGQIYFADLFIRNFYERGGIKPTVLALKGAIMKERQEDIERGWNRFLRNLSRFSAKIFNADTMDVKPIGAGVDDLKNNEIYRQSIENIALGVGMPTSHLLSDWDSYATATVDYMMWQRDDIFPHVEAIAEDLNIQVFEPLGLRLQFQTALSDAETQDEVERAQAYETYTRAGVRPSIAAQMVGIELPDGTEYDDLDKMAGISEGVAGGGNVQQQALNGAQVTSLIEVLQLVVDGRMPRESGIEVIVSSFPVSREAAERMMGEIGKGFKPEEVAASMGQVPPNGQKPGTPPNAAGNKPLPPNQQNPPIAKWLPTLDEFNELRVWKEVAQRRYKKGEPLDFDYQPHYGGLPEAVTAQIKAALLLASTAEQVKAAFDVEYSTETDTPSPEYKSNPEIIGLAESINKLADAYFKSLTLTPAPQQPAIHIQTPTINLTAQMPAPGEPSVTFAPVIQPSEVVIQNTVEVEPTPIEVKNEVNVEPADVTVNVPEKKKKNVKIKVDRDSQGRIKGAEGVVE